MRRPFTELVRLLLCVLVLSVHTQTSSQIESTDELSNYDELYESGSYSSTSFGTSIGPSSTESPHEDISTSDSAITTTAAETDEFVQSSNTFETELTYEQTIVVTDSTDFGQEDFQSSTSSLVEDETSLGYDLKSTEYSSQPEDDDLQNGQHSDSSTEYLYNSDEATSEPVEESAGPEVEYTTNLFAEDAEEDYANDDSTETTQELTSDETQAYTEMWPMDGVTDCYEGQLACYDGTCIDASLICDGTKDCPDGEDEDHLICREQGALDADEMVQLSNKTFKCDDGTFIPLENAFDAVEDCADASDEGIRAQNHKLRECFQCVVDGMCHDPSILCNGVQDCTNGSDEDETHCGPEKTTEISEAEIVDETLDKDEEISSETVTLSETDEPFGESTSTSTSPLTSTSVTTPSADSVVADGYPTAYKDGHLVLKPVAPPEIGVLHMMKCHFDDNTKFSYELIHSKFQFFKDGVPLEVLEGYKQKIDQVLNMFYVQDIKPSDFGTYRCIMILPSGEKLTAAYHLNIETAETTRAVTVSTVSSEPAIEATTTGDGTLSLTEHIPEGYDDELDNLPDEVLDAMDTQAEPLVDKEITVFKDSTVEIECPVSLAPGETPSEAYWRNENHMVEANVDHNTDGNGHCYGSLSRDDQREGSWRCYGLINGEEKFLCGFNALFQYSSDAPQVHITEEEIIDILEEYDSISTTTVAPLSEFVLEVNPSSIEVNAGDTVRLTCRGTNIPEGSGIYFIKVQPYGLVHGDLDSTRRDEQGSAEYSITIPSAKSEDSGEYECIALTPNRRVVRTDFSINVLDVATTSQPPPPPPPPPSTTKPVEPTMLRIPDAMFRRGDQAELRCQGVQREDMPFIRWSHEGRPIDERDYHTEGDVLLVRQLSDSHVGEYSCSVINGMGVYVGATGRLLLQTDEYTTEHYTPVVREDNYIVEKLPEVYISPPEISIRTGDRLDARCVWDGPEERISWLMQHPSGQQNVVAQGSRLYVENVGSPGEFQYVCRVQQHDGSVSEAALRAFVYSASPSTVEERAPTVWIIPAYQEVRVGERVQFQAHSDVDANFSWYKVTDSGDKIPFSSGSVLVLDVRSPSDGGDYVCVVRATDTGLTSEQSAQIQIVPSHDVLAPVPIIPSVPESDDVELTPCDVNEATCGDGTCIDRGLICDGKADCPGGSDERGCGSPGTTEGDCHPDQFRCKRTGQCIQKIWLCDGEKDCDDESDEDQEHCSSVPSYMSRSCKISEFQCASTNATQCIPRSYVCDETIDCVDHSDELGCVKPKIISPPQREKVITVGETLTLQCTARGTPTPFINWRLNWGHVCRDGSNRCVISHDVDRYEPDVVTGTLTVKNVVKADSGAYSCEAINTKGFDFAIPDAFVRVTVGSGQPQCNAVGTLKEVSGSCVCKLNIIGAYCQQCKPGYYYPSNENPHGCASCFCSGVSKDCVSDDSKREMKLIEITSPGNLWYLVHRHYPKNPWIGMGEVDREIGTITFNQFNTAPSGDLYWSPPESKTKPVHFPLGNLILAYGGNIRIKVKDEGYGTPFSDAMHVILWIRGNNIDLIHQVTPSQIRSVDGFIEYVVRLTERSFTRLDQSPLDRPHMLMALANVDKFWVRASINNNPISVTLSSITIEVASRFGQGNIANEVEKCKCPVQYTGSSCELCAPGYTRRHGVGLYLGECYSCREHCHGRTDECDPETGTCLNCGGNTFGERCVDCLPNFILDKQTNQCVRSMAHSQGALPPILIDQKPVNSLQAVITIVIRPGRQKLIKIESEEVNIPSTAWLRVDQLEGGAISLPPGMHQVGSDLMIDSPTPEMAGTYQVTLYLKDGRVVTPTVVLQYDEALLPSIEPSGVVRKEINDYITIAVNTHNIPVRGIMWLKDGVNLPPTVTVESHRIIIEKLSADLCGVYEAHVYFNQPQPLVLKTTLECTYNQIYSPVGPPGAYGGAPQITLSPSDLNLIEGQSMVVTYEIMGEEPSNLIWQHWRDSTWIDMPSSFVVQRDKLILNNSRLTDSGIYRVQATNRHGTGQATLRLNVEPHPYESHVNLPPSVKFPNAVYEIPVHQYANIMPEIQINAPYTVYWAKADGSPLPPGMQVHGDGIVIQSMRPEYSGTYTIEVITDDAQTKVPVDVDAIELPYQTAIHGLSLNIDGPAKSTISAGDDVTLKCRAKGEYRGGAVITWVMQPNPTLPQNTQESNGALTITNFGKENEGIYVCNAVSGDHQSADATIELRLASEAVQHRPSYSLSWLPSSIIDANEDDSLEAQCVGVPDSRAIEVSVVTRRGAEQSPEWLEVSDGRVRISSVSSNMNEMRLICRAPNVDPSLVSELTINVNSDYSQAMNDEPVQPAGRLEVALPSKLDVDAGSDFELKCDVQGASPGDLKITWTKHGRTGVEGLPAHLQATSGVLRGTNVSPADYAYYMCTAERVSTGEQAVAYVLLDVQNAKLKPTVKVYPSENVQISFGASASLVCYAYDGEPSPTISWQRADGRIFGVNVQTRSGQLDIHSATSEDSGTYMCVAENIAGQSKATVNVEVQSPQKIDLIVNPDEIGDVEDDTPRYAQCIAVGTPVPKVKWMHQNKNLTREEDGYSLLLVTPATLSAGQNTFTCVADNTYVRASKDLNVNVIRSMPFVPYTLPSQIDAVLQINPREVTENGRVQLGCSVGTHFRNPLSFTWLRDGQIVETKESIGGSAVLELVDVSAEDGGLYKCEVYDNSKLVAVSNDEQLNVVRRLDRFPRISALIRDVFVQSGSLAKLKCRILNRIKGKVIWDRLNGQLPDRTIIRKATMRIENVRPEDEGVYKCVAFNEIGSSEDFINLNVLEMSSPQEITVRLVAEPSLKTSYGMRSTLICRTSHSKGSVVWQKDGRRIFRSGVTINNDRLQFYPQQSDVGVYSCYILEDGLPLGNASLELVVKDARSSALEYVPASSPPFQQQQSQEQATIQPATSRPILISIRPLHGVYRVDNELAFECDTSVVGARIRWERQRPTSAFSSFTTVDENRLMFQRFTSNDVGEYKCVVEKGNMKGEKYLHMDIDVVNNDVIFAYPDHPLVISHGSPNINVTFLNPPSEFKKNGIVEVECIVSGQRDAPISWSREDGKDVGSNVNIDKGIMKINGFVESNLGEYKCSAETYVGDLSRVIVFEPESFPGIFTNTTDNKPKIEFQFLSSRQDFRAGGHVIVECIPNDKSATIEWHRIGDPTSAHMKIDNQFLNINPFSYEDIGVYECIASGSMGIVTRSIQFDENDLSSSILPNNQEVLPSVRLEFNDLNKYEIGGKIEIKCVADNDPNANVQWHRGERKTFGYRTESRGDILRFNDYDNSDSGIYSCIASNNQGSKYISVEISTDERGIVRVTNERINQIPIQRTRYPLVVEFLSPLSQFRKEGEITAICYFSGNVPGIISWRKVDEKTNHTVPMSSNAMTEGSRLHFPRFSEDHLGTYECSGVSEHGVAHKIVSLDAEAFTAVNPTYNHENKRELQITVDGTTSGEKVKFNCKLRNARIAVKWESQRTHQLPNGARQIGTRLIFDKFYPTIHHDTYTCKARHNGNKFYKSIDTREVIFDKSDIMVGRRLHIRTATQDSIKALCSRGTKKVINDSKKDFYVFQCDRNSLIFSNRSFYALDALNLTLPVRHRLSIRSQLGVNCIQDRGKSEYSCSAWTTEDKHKQFPIYCEPDIEEINTLHCRRNNLRTKRISPKLFTSEKTVICSVDNSNVRKVFMVEATNETISHNHVYKLRNVDGIEIGKCETQSEPDEVETGVPFVPVGITIVKVVDGITDEGNENELREVHHSTVRNERETATNRLVNVNEREIHDFEGENHVFTVNVLGDQASIENNSGMVMDGQIKKPLNRNNGIDIDLKERSEKVEVQFRATSDAVFYSEENWVGTVSEIAYGEEKFERQSKKQSKFEVGSETRSENGEMKYGPKYKAGIDDEKSKIKLETESKVEITNSETTNENKLRSQLDFNVKIIKETLNTESEVSTSKEKSDISWSSDFPTSELPDLWKHFTQSNIGQKDILAEKQIINGSSTESSLATFPNLESTGNISINKTKVWIPVPNNITEISTQFPVPETECIDYTDIAATDINHVGSENQSEIFENHETLAISVSSTDTIQAVQLELPKPDISNETSTADFLAEKSITMSYDLLKNQKKFIGLNLEAIKKLSDTSLISNGTLTLKNKTISSEESLKNEANNSRIFTKKLVSGLFVVIRSNQGTFDSAVCSHESPDKFDQTYWISRSSYALLGFAIDNTMIDLGTSGIYTCMGSDPNDGQISIDVNSRDYESSVFNIFKEPSISISIDTESEAIVIDCRADDQAEIQWIKDGYLLQVQPKHHIRAGILIIDEPVTDDYGIYTCIATSPDMRGAKADINLNEKNVGGIVANVANSKARTSMTLKFVSPKNKMKLGGSLSVLCTVDPRGSIIRWKFDDGRALPDNAKAEENGLLVINDLTIQNNGIYTCESYTVSGRRIKSFRIDFN